MSTKAQTRDFFELVKAIGESKSKQEEDRIIADEVLFLKKAVPQPGLNKKKMKELVIRSIYVEMLGNDASFAYIKAVELCASTSIAQKRAGYLAASLCLSPDHEFRFMLVNMIQRDMKSNNQLEVCAALSAVNKLVTEDMIPAVIGEVTRLLKHEMELVRKKAVGALHRLYQMDQTCLADHIPKIRAALCDKDPSVMGATLPLFADMITNEPSRFKDLVPSFVSILKQIIDHRLPREYDYHRIPSPWIQMNLLRVLTLLGRGDQQASEGMYEVLVDVMKRADTGINIGYAIVYEVVKTVTTIYPNTLLLDAAATSISRFIRSDSHNLKYIGIKGLASIVKDHPRYAADHQMAVIDCLEDPDETLKRKTLELLFRMTNAVNVEFIVEKLLSFLATATDDHFRTALVGQITQCAERFAPSNAWYVQTVIRVFELAGEKVKTSVAHTLMQLIAEGTEVDEDVEEGETSADDELRTEAVESFLDLMERPKLPEVLAQAMAWVMGEYGYLSTSCSKEQIMDMLCDLAEQSADAATKSHIITAIMKLVAQNGSCPSRVNSIMDNYSKSVALDVQQRCLEFRALLKHSGTMVDVLPVDASCEDIDVDENLSFLNAYVQNALDTGAKPYNPPADFIGDADGNSGKVSLKITPYAAPMIPQATTSMATIGVSPTGAAGAAAGAPPIGAAGIGGAAGPAGAGAANMGPGVGGAGSNQAFSTSQGNQLINARGVNQVWGKKPEPPPPAPAPAAGGGTDSAAHPPQPPAAGGGGLLDGMTISSSSGAGGPTIAGAATAVAEEPAAPTAPRELTEKEKMAAALFGGVSTTGGNNFGPNSAARSRRRSQQRSLSPTPASSTSSAPPPTAAAPVPAAVDGSAIPSASSNDPNPTAAAAVTGGGGGAIDLLGMDMDAPAATMPATAALGATGGLGSPDLLNTTGSTAAPAAAPSGGGLSVSDAFADMSIGTTSAVSAPPPPPAAATGFGGGDMFGGLSTVSATPSVQPLQITTAQFGQRWGSTPFDAKQSLQCVTSGPQSLEQLRRAMPQCYHHVESIPNTQEAIFSATTASATGGVVLVHVKLNATRKTCDLVVKSSAREICSQEASSIANTLMAFRS